MTAIGQHYLILPASFKLPKQQNKQRVTLKSSGPSFNWLGPNEFSAWESLIKIAEASAAAASDEAVVSNLRLAYDNFLAKFPLCFGYWKKYADAENKLDGPEKAEQIFERGVTAIHNSIDLWNHYLQFKVEKSDDAEA
ncbi:hypothetical protein HK100_012829, partial [Physocladia obscura]